MSIRTFSLVSLSTLLLLAACTLSGVQSDISTARLEAGARYEAVIDGPGGALRHEDAVQLGQANDFWVRLGHEPDVVYFDGPEPCDSCSFDNEHTFFSDDRIYVNPIADTIVLYRTTVAGELQIANFQEDIFISITPSADITQDAASEAIRETLAMFSPDGESEIEIGGYIRLPKEGLRP